jgi:mono/diheme cytochrome c family protein
LLALGLSIIAAPSRPAGGQEAGGGADASPQAVKSLLDEAERALAEGQPAKASARLVQAAATLGRLPGEGSAAAGRRALLGRLKSLRGDLELEGVDVSGIEVPAAKPAPAKAKPPAATATPTASARDKPAAGPAGAAPAGVSFTSQVAPLLARHCGGCHVAGKKGGFQMASYAGLMKSGMVQAGQGEVSRLVETILSGDMPRGGGKVSPQDLAVIVKWIDAGARFDGSDPDAALDGAGRGAAAPAPSVRPEAMAAVALKPGDVSFASDIAPILLDQCAGCHDANQPEGNLSMTTLERLVRGGRGGAAIMPGRGAESLLVKKLKGTGIEGQRMPLGKPPLADDLITLVQRWIDQGAKLDMLTPKAELETLVAAGRSRRLSHADLRKVRFEAAERLYTRAIPDEQARREEREDLLLVGNTSASRLALYAVAAADVEQRLRTDLLGGEGPLVKGGMVVYVFAKAYDLSSFWQTVLSGERPRGIMATAGATGDVAYVAMALPAAGGSESDEAADARALLTEQMAATMLLDRGAPAWFARGAGRALAMKAEPKAPLVQGWQRDLPAALKKVGSATDLLAGQGDPATSTTVGGGFVAAIMPTPGRLGDLVGKLASGTPFDQAFAAVFRGGPQPLFEAWAAKAAKSSRR